MFKLLSVEVSSVHLTKVTSQDKTNLSHRVEKEQLLRTLIGHKLDVIKDGI